MKQRNPFIVFILSFLTLGLYSWYWSIATKTEINKLGGNIPTAWIWLIPFVGILWWDWKYCQGVEYITKGKFNAILTFFFLFFLNLFFVSSIGKAILQDSFNSLKQEKITV